MFFGSFIVPLVVLEWVVSEWVVSERFFWMALIVVFMVYSVSMAFLNVLL